MSKQDDDAHAEPAAHNASPEAIMQLLQKAILEYQGSTTALDRAMGMYMICCQTGWKPLYLMRDKRKIKEAEQILGIIFRDHFPEVGSRPDKSLAWRTLTKAQSFWRAVRGDYPDVRSSEIGDE